MRGETCGDGGGRATLLFRPVRPSCPST